MMIMLTIQEKIIRELKRLNLGSNAYWRFQSFNIFKWDLSPVEQRDLAACMDEWCQAGYFVKEKDGSVFRYRITEKGEQMIWEN
jgi:hypothetical protein